MLRQTTTLLPNQSRGQLVWLGTPACVCVCHFAVMQTDGQTTINGSRHQSRGELVGDGLGGLPKHVCPGVRESPIPGGGPEPDHRRVLVQGDRHRHRVEEEVPLRFALL